MIWCACLRELKDQAAIKEVEPLVAKKGNSLTHVSFLTEEIPKNCVIWLGLRKFLEIEFVLILCMKKAGFLGPVLLLEVERCVQNF